MKKRLPSAVYNPISALGAALALVSFCTILFLVLLDAFSQHTAPYMGILVFIVIPVFLIFGLILIPIGMIIERKRRLKLEKGELPKAFYVDLGKKSHRLAVTIFLIGTSIFLLATAVGSYQAYEFTESVTFCGQICHTVMKPEYTAYQNSPHARVTCAECHVGAGAGWYVQSKLSGAYQVYSALFNKYPKPIPTPIKNLRPARETCEQCHWPDKFHGSTEKLINHYLADEENTAWPIRMLIKTGGGDRETGKAIGIHWHLNLDNQIDYIATDDKRQDIPWVRVRDRNGKERIFISQDEPIEPDSVANYEMRTMDCIDCHNRPAHNYLSPDKTVEQAITANKIDRTLPSVKQFAIESLIEDYSTTDSAMIGIAEHVKQAYEDEFPEIAESRAADIDTTIVQVQRIYRNNFFPEMKVRWDEYPENIGHFANSGCFRCHDGNHVSETGEVITHDCNSCHSILSQGNDGDAKVVDLDGLEFKHPVDIDEAWRETPCSECHTGTSQL